MSEHDKNKFLRDRFLTRRLENKLDKMIGFFYWKTYVATTLYANISTPINLTITIFTALMTAHSSSSTSFISAEMNMTMNLVTFLLSILNSYFTPQKEFNELNEYLMKWSHLGNEFEKTIYTSNSYEDKIKSYTLILDNCVNLYKEQYLKKRNFLTDLLHVLVRIIFMGSNDRWMKHETFDFYDKINKVIELDFDLERFKQYKTNSSLFRRLCACFKNCFNCCRKKSTNKKDKVGLLEPEFDEEKKMAKQDSKENQKQSNNSSSTDNKNNIKHFKTESVIFEPPPNKEQVLSGSGNTTPRQNNSGSVELTDIKVN